MDWGPRGGNRSGGPSSRGHTWLFLGLPRHLIVGQRCWALCNPPQHPAAVVDLTVEELAFADEVATGVASLDRLPQEFPLLHFGAKSADILRPRADACESARFGIKGGGLCRPRSSGHVPPSFASEGSGPLLSLRIALQVRSIWQ
jgi:hypothetical protein